MEQQRNQEYNLRTFARLKCFLSSVSAIVVLLTREWKHSLCMFYQNKLTIKEYSHNDEAIDDVDPITIHGSILHSTPIHK